MNSINFTIDQFKYAYGTKVSRTNLNISNDHKKYYCTANDLNQIADYLNFLISGITSGFSISNSNFSNFDNLITNLSGYVNTLLVDDISGNISDTLGATTRAISNYVRNYVSGQFDDRFVDNISANISDDLGATTRAISNYVSSYSEDFSKLFLVESFAEDYPESGLYIDEHFETRLYANGGKANLAKPAVNTMSPPTDPQYVVPTVYAVGNYVSGEFDSRLVGDISAHISDDLGATTRAISSYVNNRIEIENNKYVSYPIGSIFAMSVFEPAQGAFWLNGQVLQDCENRYPQFWEWITRNLANNTILRYNTNEEYDNILRNYGGNCGGFVIDTVNKSVRLPCLINGTLWSGQNVIGQHPGGTIRAGLPNISGTFPGLESSAGKASQFNASFTGPFYIASANCGVKVDNESGNEDHVYGFNASLCNPIYGNSQTVQPPAIRVLWCIQVYHRRCVVSTFNQTNTYLEQQIQSLKNQITNINSTLTVNVNPNINSLINTVGQINTNLNDLHNYANDIHFELSANVSPNINALTNTVSNMDYVIDSKHIDLQFPGHPRTCLV